MRLREVFSSVFNGFQGPLTFEKNTQLLRLPLRRPWHDTGAIQDRLDAFRATLLGRQ